MINQQKARRRLRKKELGQGRGSSSSIHNPKSSDRSHSKSRTFAPNLCKSSLSAPLYEINLNPLSTFDPRRKSQPLVKRSLGAASKTTTEQRPSGGVHKHLQHCDLQKTLVTDDDLEFVGERCNMFLFYVRHAWPPLT